MPTGRTILDRIRALSRQRFESEAEFLKACRLSPGYMANLEDRIEGRRKAGKDPTTVTIQLDAAVRMARALGVHVEALAGEYIAGDRGDPYPDRYWAAEAARFVGLPEAAIRTVMSQKPKHDLGRQAWFKRIEAEAMALREGDSVVPLLPGKTAERA